MTENNSIGLPRTNCAWPTQLPSTIGWLILWTSGKQCMPFASTSAGLLTWSPVAPRETNRGVDMDHGQIPRWVKDILVCWVQRATVNTLKCCLFKSNVPQRLIPWLILSSSTAWVMAWTVPSAGWHQFRGGTVNTLETRAAGRGGSAGWRSGTTRTSQNVTKTNAKCCT